MQALLIYNPNSGGSQAIDPDSLLAALGQAGFEPVYEATTTEDDLDRLLETAKGLVVAAGGDGTVRAAATRLVRMGMKLPITILPIGTANNVARSLGIAGSPLDLIAGLAAPCPRPLDVGVVETPWGEEYFLEAFGMGLYAEALSIYEPEKGKSVLRSIATAVQLLNQSETRFYSLQLDGQDISGAYQMVTALNTSAFGPRIPAAPQADPGDGLMDVLRVREDERDSLLRYLGALINQQLEQLPSVNVDPGRRLQVAWTGFPFHVDAEVRPRHAGWEKYAGKDGILLQVRIAPGALEVWAPGETGGERAESEPGETAAGA